MLISQIILFGLILFLLYRIAKRDEQLSFFHLLIGYIIKISAALIFIFIYTNHYGNGTLSADASDFLFESKIMNKIYHNSPSDYFKLFFGFDEIGELSKIYLSDTHHWDSNSQLLFNDNRNLMRFHSLIYFVSGGWIFIHIAVSSLISLIAFYLIAKSFAHWFNLKLGFFFLFCLCLPSVLFWSSTILKEPFLFLGIGLVLYSLLNTHSKLKQVSLFLLGSLFLLAFKPYILFCMLPGLIFYYVVATKSWLKTSVFLIGSIVIFVTTILFTPIGQNITEKLTRKQFDFLNISQGGTHLIGNNCFYYIEPSESKKLHVVDEEEATILEDVVARKFDYQYKTAPKDTLISKGAVYAVIISRDPSNSFIPVREIEDKPSRLLGNIPEALMNVILRPFLWDSGSLLLIPAAIESLILILSFAFGLRYWKRLTSKEKTIFIAVWIFILALALLIGWVTPVHGAINRYRTPIYLAIGILTYFLYSKRKQHEKNSAN